MSADEDYEMLDVVDAEDIVVGTMTRGEIHAKRLFHRSVHVLLHDETGRIYLQRRSFDKSEHPGKWDASASGHVESGESYREAAGRELEEEIGVRASPERVLWVRGTRETAMEHSMLFRVRLERTDPRPEPNPGEILEGRFFEPGEIEEGLSKEPEAFSPSFQLLFHLYRQETGEGSV